MIRTLPIAAVILLLLAKLASGQTLMPSPSSNLAGAVGGRHHTTFTGQSCLTFYAYPKILASNKDIYEHWIKATNACPQNIKVKICYYDTDDCIMITVPPLDQKRTILGIYPALKSFRYTATEQFN
jgi:hypothetical protein